MKLKVFIWTQAGINLSFSIATSRVFKFCQATPRERVWQNHGTSSARPSPHLLFEWQLNLAFKYHCRVLGVRALWDTWSTPQPEPQEASKCVHGRFYCLRDRRTYFRMFVTRACKSTECTNTQRFFCCLVTLQNTFQLRKCDGRLKLYRKGCLIYLLGPFFFKLGMVNISGASHKRFHSTIHWITQPVDRDSTFEKNGVWWISHIIGLALDYPLVSDLYSAWRHRHFYNCRRPGWHRHRLS